MTARYAIGIDLGTTNCVFAYCELAAEEPVIELLPLPQLVAPGTVEARTSLPSFLYLADQEEADQGHLRLPWIDNRDYAVGVLARDRSADRADQTVSAAKSWLCHSRVDRHAELLPWQSEPEKQRVSPVEATRRYLLHLIEAWEHAHPDAPFVQQQVVLTVPASFDPSARELTREAAIAAGFPDEMMLFEEPQAAVYAWLHDARDEWRKQLQLGDRLLVVDVGGGTTDLSLIEVDEESGDLVLQRQAVGQHLLVGGDNMDLLLAHIAAGEFQEQGVSLDPWQSVALWHQCRAAKETLLSHDGPQTQNLTIRGRGRKLIGGAVSVEMQLESVQQALLDGFFPLCDLGEKPHRQRSSGFQEIGLPFESDTAITRHVAAFLSQQTETEEDVRPTHILFNGGVFRADVIRERVMQQLQQWFKKGTIPVNLEGPQALDNNVSRGAAFYGWSKSNGSVRIRGGAPQAYYVGIETAGLAIPGAPRPLHALCVVPCGMEEGTEIDVPSKEIGLVVGESAEFRFFGSPARKTDQAGDVLQRWTSDELTETAPLATTLPADESSEDTFVPVRFQSRLTELGMLELWCVSTHSDARWKLEFSIRDQPDTTSE